MAEKIFEIEYHPGEEVVFRFKMSGFSLMPEASRSHFKTTRREILLALRDLLDNAIEPAEEPRKTKKRSKIEIK